MNEKEAADWEAAHPLGTDGITRALAEAEAELNGSSGMKPAWFWQIQSARASGPDDLLTKLTLAAVRGVGTLLSAILFPVGVVTTFLGGILIALTFGLILIPINLVWLLLFGGLAATSWLWLRAWYLRPLLVLPGVLLAIMGTIFVVLIPMPEETLRGEKALKGFLASEWPLTWLIWQGSSDNS